MLLGVCDTLLSISIKVKELRNLFFYNLECRQKFFLGIS